MDIIKPPFQQGRLLATKTTATMTEHARAVAEAHEQRLVFAGFTSADEGRSRQYVAECATPELAKFIVTACNAYSDLLEQNAKLREENTALQAECTGTRMGLNNVQLLLTTAQDAMDQAVTMPENMPADVGRSIAIMQDHCSPEAIYAAIRGDLSAAGPA